MGGLGTLAAELQERVEAARERTAMSLARSGVLVEASRYLRAREAKVPQCAWCARVALGGRWLEETAVPGFLADALEERATHGICPEPLPPSLRRVDGIAVHAGGWQAADVLARELERFAVRVRPDYVLEASVPADDETFVGRLLSRIADCIARDHLDAVQVRIGPRTYRLNGR
jgi:hypothetical protein